MKKLPRILPLVVLLFLFGASSSFADTLQVTFTATIDLISSSETVSGSFLWNTQTEVLSNILLEQQRSVYFSAGCDCSGLRAGGEFL